MLDKSFAESFYTLAYDGRLRSTSYFEPSLKIEHAAVELDAVRRRCPEARRILEIGSGLGAFVHVALREGFDAIGTEMSSAAVRRARELFDISLHLGAADNMPDGPPFDVVVLWDVIEHCPNPDAVLAEAARRLRSGGWILLTTGNYESAARLSGGNDWWCWAADHYHYFRPAGIELMGKRCGLSNFNYGRLERSNPSAPGAIPVRPSPLRLLNPLRVWRGLLRRGRSAASRVLWPRHWHIGVMCCELQKP